MKAAARKAEDEAKKAVDDARHVANLSRLAETAGKAAEYKNTARTLHEQARSDMRETFGYQKDTEEIVRITARGQEVGVDSIESNVSTPTNPLKRPASSPSALTSQAKLPASNH
jgi:hypothetical protein